MSPYGSAVATGPIVQFESARWLPTLLSDLRSLETTGENIPGLGDLRVSRATADNVRVLLTAISTAPLPEPTLAPVSGGGVALTCNIGNRELILTTYPNQSDFVFVLRNENDVPVDEGIITLEQRDRLLDVIRTFLANSAR
jgi:hypothetical protein